MIYNISLQQVINVMTNKGYILYNGDNVSQRSLNIVGIRNRALSPAKFDDTLVVFNLIEGLNDFAAFPITTDPSRYFLLNPITREPPTKYLGTAFLKEGQYENIYKIDKHKSSNENRSHTAVCQRYGNVTVYRDDTRDGKMNFDYFESGKFGINIHKSWNQEGDWNSSTGKYSLGCQVFADDDDFNIFLTRCKTERDKCGNVFTYTLLNEEDFD